MVKRTANKEQLVQLEVVLRLLVAYACFRTFHPIPDVRLDVHCHLTEVPLIDDKLCKNLRLGTR